MLVKDTPLTEDQKQLASDNYKLIDKAIGMFINKGNVDKKDSEEVRGYVTDQYIILIRRYDTSMGTFEGYFAKYVKGCLRTYYNNMYKFDSIPDGYDDECLTQKQVDSKLLRASISHAGLKPLELTVLFKYYHGKRNMTHIGEEVGTSKQYVHVVLRSALEKCREYFNKNDITMDLLRD